LGSQATKGVIEMNFQSMRLSSRIQSLVGLMLLGLLSISLVSVFQMKHTLIEDRMEKTRNLVETGASIITRYNKLAQEGKLSEEEAKKAAIEDLRTLRYGSNDYFFIIDTNYVYVLQPAKPEVEGHNVHDLKDANGVFLIQELVKVAHNGGGFVNYAFPRAGKTEPEPKLSYATLFTPWGWVLGTGIYINDVDEHFHNSVLSLGEISLVLVALLSLIGWLIGSSILNQLGGEPSEAARIMKLVAAGDLTAKYANPRAGSLLANLDSMVTTLRNLVTEINASANNLVQNAEQIKNASRQIAGAAEQQSNATASMAAAIEELTVSSNNISDRARNTEKDSREAMSHASEGSQHVGDASTAIQMVASAVEDASASIRTLEERATQISSIANVIKEIAGQTNLLALNAAIEAARAGEQGRGFAVVADEVRKLAERTAVATTEIEKMITGIQNDTVTSVDAMNAVLPKVHEGVHLANTASEALLSIENGADRTLSNIIEVANATSEQTSASTLITRQVEQISQMLEETTVTIRQTANSAQELEHIAQGLKTQINQFKV